ncbi:serine hydrolase-like protein [Ornithodoros turicata]|uniref:serine hydrolase-like protein n=1 Tax=Ornithodoros turicata TaxID=34597 RepID=UPI003138DC68
MLVRSLLQLGKWRGFTGLPTHETSVARLQTTRQSSSTSLKERRTRDLVVPVPHGYLFGRQWGPDDGQPVLALHGWQDNAASFESLVPLLKSEFQLVAVDFSGHGLSSHLPSSHCYCRDQYLDDVRRTADYLQWDTFSIMGHDMGAGTGYFFALLFPERVSRLISIEGTFPASYPRSATRRNNDDRRRYTKQEILDIFRSRHVSAEAARAIMTRAFTTTAEGHHVRHDDVRVREVEPDNLFPGLFDRKLSRFRNSLLVISKELGLLNAASTNVAAAEALMKCLGAEMCAKFKYVSVDGSHHVHLEAPEKVAPHVNDFLCT